MADDDSPTDSTHSVTRLINRVKQQDQAAAQEIWQRYFSRLLPLAKAKLRGLPDQVADEEDLLVSVFDRFFRAAADSRFARLDDRDDLWQILLLLTDRKTVDHFRRTSAQRRGGGVQIGGLDEMDLQTARDQANREPSPEWVASFNENLGLALRRLRDESTREVALLKMEGYANQEIADRLQVSLSTVERKLRVTRTVWREEFAEGDAGRSDFDDEETRENRH